jgi:vitamin B12 transporter
MDIKKLLFFVFLLSISVSSQQKDSVIHHRLSDIIISATGTRTSSMHLANSVTVIDSAEINRREKISLLDLLKSEYGLSYITQGYPGASFVTIRGGGTGHTLVLIDGIEMNMPTDPGNTFDFSTVTTENVERIEILRGPQSTLYGGDALAGVINIFTKSGSKGLRLNLSSEGGSYNTYRGSAGLSGGTDILNFNINYGRVTSEGYSSAAERFGNTERDGFRNSTISARGGVQIDSLIGFDVRFHFTKVNADLDRFGGEGGDDPTYLADTEESGLRGSFNSTLFNIWEQTIGLSYNRNFRKYRFDETPLFISSSSSRYDGNKIKFDWQNNIYLPLNSSTDGIEQVLTAGFEFEKEETSSEYHEYGVFPYSSIFPRASNNTYGIYLQDQLNIKNSFFLISGGRYDINKTFGSKVTYRFAPAYLFPTGTKLKASYGTGFKSPSLFYLFDPVYGNQDLKPEESNGWDAGVEQYFFNFPMIAGITYFNLNFTQMFGFDLLTYKTVNINKASTEGVELYLDVELTRKLRLKTNYTFTQIRDKSDGSGSSVLLRRPKHKSALIADYNLVENVYTGFEIIYTGNRSDIYYPRDFSLPPQDIVMKNYTIINLNLSYTLLNSLKLYTRLENLLNSKYEEIYGFGTPGFAIYGGVKFNTNNLFN